MQRYLNAKVFLLFEVVEMESAEMESNDFYDGFEESLEDDEITAAEAGFMKGFKGA